MARSVVLLLKLVILTLKINQILCQNQTATEFFSSIQNMELLLKSELAVLDRLDAYIKTSEEKITLLKSERDRLRGNLKGASKNPIAYVSNPVSAFLMTKRLLEDYKDVDELIREDIGIDVIDESTVLPSSEDLRGIAEGLSRLQNMYMLDVTELAKGTVLGHQLFRELNSEECYSIGVAMADDKYFSNANHWFREALNRWEADDFPTVGKLEILDYYSYSLSEDGKYEEALEVTDQLLKLDPAHAGGLAKKKIIESWLDHIKRNGRRRELPDPAIIKLYDQTCRGELQRTASETSQLYCRYEISTTPFLRLAPLKMEVANLDPFVAIYHDAVSDREIAKLIELAGPQIKRSKVGDGKKNRTGDFRISQNSWLLDDHDAVVATINRRTKDMARGLNEQAFENLQVNNYGIGGHYMPHYDWSRSAVPFSKLGKGNRIATLMFYLSDVEEGGATAFPRLGFGVWPKKGTAIFWYNLYRNGKGNRRTLHGACPVLIGSKWVANKWIHERSQEFVRPCDLDPMK